MTTNLADQFLKDTEEVTVPKGTTFDFDNLYTKLILKENTPSHIAFLTDWLRIIKLKVHWNATDKKMDLCNDHYKEPCLICNPPKKESSEDKKKEDRNGATISRLAFVYNFDRIGVIKESSNGTVYEEDPVCIVELKGGTAGINFTTLEEANCEHPDFSGKYDFYIQNGKTDKWDLNPETLVNNYLMYTEGGEDKIWQLRKTKEGKKTSYLEPKILSRSKAQQNLGKDIKLTVPKEVRAYFNKKSAYDLLPYMLTHNGNVQWEKLGLEPPKEGGKLSMKTKVDADKEL